MTERDVPRIDPQTDAAVRARLDDARVAEPMPADVAARLDRVLADLQADQQTDRPTGTTGMAPAASTVSSTSTGPADLPARTDELAVRRRHRRRLGTGALVAAAALVVGGVSVSSLLGSGPEGPDSADSTDSTAVSESPGDRSSDGPGGTGGSKPGDRLEAPEDTLAAAPGAPSAGAPDGPTSVDLRLTRDALRDPRGPAARELRRLRADATTPEDSSARAALGRCASAVGGADRVLPARYERRAALVVYRTGSRTIDVLTCDDGPRRVRRLD